MKFVKSALLYRGFANGNIKSHGLLCKHDLQKNNDAKDIVLHQICQRLSIRRRRNYLASISGDFDSRFMN